MPEQVAAIVEGVAEGCRRAGCALLGGETAEHPGVMPDDQFDLAGFCVGVVDEDRLLGPDRVREGDVLIGLAVERAARERLLASCGSALLGRYPSMTTPPGWTAPLGDELLEPCAIYAPEVLSLRDARAAARRRPHHRRRVPRERPSRPAARASAPDDPSRHLAGAGDLRAGPREAADASDDDLFSTFNMGVGMVLVVDPGNVEEILRRSQDRAFAIGEVVAGSGVHIA